MSGGVIVDDFDNDGRLDVVTSSIDSCAPLRLFRRNDDGTFTDRAAQAGLATQLGGLNIVQTDYNNDGHLDILVLRGGWETPQRKSLLRNNGDGTFTDVTVASGLAKAPTGTQAAVWTDIDNDGFLDLFVGNENGPAQLFRNKRDGTFDDIAEKAGVARRGIQQGRYGGRLRQRRLARSVRLELRRHEFPVPEQSQRHVHREFGRGAGVPGPGQGFPTWFFDYDNDGFQDIFVGSFVTSVDEAARAYLRLPRNGNTLKLYRNLGDGSFQDVTRQAGLDKVLMVMGANFGDIDNDGFLDIYLGTGNPSYASLVPSLLLRNKGGKSFVDVTAASGTGELHKGHGVAFADLDHDGDQEIVFEVGGATPGDAHALRLFENPGHGNDWITLEADRREDQPGGDWRADHRHGRRRGRAARHAPQRRERRIVRRVAAPAADRARLGRASRRRGDLVADEQHASALLERGQEPVPRDHRIRAGAEGCRAALPAAGTAMRKTAIAGARVVFGVGLALALIAAVPSQTSGQPFDSAQGRQARHVVRGMVLTVDAARKTRRRVARQHSERDAGDDDAVRGAGARRELDGLVPGAIVSFTLVVSKESAHAEGLRDASGTRASSRIR